MEDTVYTFDFFQLSLNDVPRGGGKNASPGQLYCALRPLGIGVMNGFDPDDVRQLAVRSSETPRIFPLRRSPASRRPSLMCAAGKRSCARSAPTVIATAESKIAS